MFFGWRHIWVIENEKAVVSLEAPFDFELVHLDEDIDFDIVNDDPDNIGNKFVFEDVNQSDTNEDLVVTAEKIVLQMALL